MSLTIRRHCNVGHCVVSCDVDNTIRAYIGVAIISHLRTSVIEFLRIQRKSHDVEIVIYLTMRDYSLWKEFAPRGSKFIPLREADII